MNYKIKNISKENFKNYGDLITTSNKEYESINKNTTDSFFDLANIQIIGDDKRSRLNISNFCFHLLICLHLYYLLNKDLVLSNETDNYL